MSSRFQASRGIYGDPYRRSIHGMCDHVIGTKAPVRNVDRVERWEANSKTPCQVRTTTVVRNSVVNESYYIGAEPWHRILTVQFALANTQ